MRCGSGVSPSSCSDTVRKLTALLCSFDTGMFHCTTKVSQRSETKTGRGAWCAHSVSYLVVAMANGHSKSSETEIGSLRDRHLRRSACIFTQRSSPHSNWLATVSPLES